MIFPPVITECALNVGIRGWRFACITTVIIRPQLTIAGHFGLDLLIDQALTGLQRQKLVTKTVP